MSIASLLHFWVQPTKATSKMMLLFLIATLLLLISCEVRTIDVQGHRGARGLRPENTLSGFDLAIDFGEAISCNSDFLFLFERCGDLVSDFVYRARTCFA